MARNLLRGYPHGVACDSRDPMVSPTPSLPPEFRLFSDVLAAPVLMQCLPRVLPAHICEPPKRFNHLWYHFCECLCDPEVEIRADQGWLWGEGLPALL